MRAQTVLGYSLIEAMIAALVVAIGFMGLTQIHSQFLASTQHANTYTEAMNFAQAKLEDLRNFATRAEFDNLAGGQDACDPKTAESPCQGLGQSLQRYWSISPCPNAVDCRQLTAEVRWGENNEHVVLTTLLAGAQPVQAGVLLD